MDNQIRRLMGDMLKQNLENVRVATGCLLRGLCRLAHPQPAAAAGPVVEEKPARRDGELEFLKAWPTFLGCGKV